MNKISACYFIYLVCSFCRFFVFEHNHSISMSYKSKYTYFLLKSWMAMSRMWLSRMDRIVRHGIAGGGDFISLKLHAILTFPLIFFNFVYFMCSTLTPTHDTLKRQTFCPLGILPNRMMMMCPEQFTCCLSISRKSPSSPKLAYTSSPWE